MGGVVAVRWDGLARGGTAAKADAEMCFLQQSRDHRWPPVLSVGFATRRNSWIFGLIACQVVLDMILAVAASTL
jgi:hypothetical protein